MNRLYDTSSLIELIFSDGAAGLEDVFDEAILDLTIYEVGNVLWKANALQGRITDEQRDTFLTLLEESEPDIERLSIGSVGLETVMEIGIAEELTFYDTAYVAVARELDLTLVTEDAKLQNKASSYVTIETIGRIS